MFTIVVGLFSLMLGNDDILIAWVVTLFMDYHIVMQLLGG